MTTQQARDYFSKLQLSYEDINLLNLSVLINLIKDELKFYFHNGGEHAQQMDLKIEQPLKKNVRFNNDGLDFAYITVKGSYFKGREAITFQRSGFIGFCGELSETNTQPVLKAFCTWCDKIAQLKGE